MKAQFAARDTLYESMDEFIYAFKDRMHDLPWITLDSVQFQLFKEFNEPESNAYFYKKILIRCSS